MSYIWSSDRLADLSRHGNAEVREWAMEKLSALYPENAGDTAVALINDKDVSVAQAALDHLSDHPAGAHAEALFRSYRIVSGVIAGRTAGALAKLGDSRIVDAFREKYGSLTKIRRDLIGYASSVLHLSSFPEGGAMPVIKDALPMIAEAGEFGPSIAPAVFQAGLSAGLDIADLFALCWKHRDPRSLLIMLLAAIEGSCGSWYQKEDVEEAGDEDQPLPAMARESMEYIGEHGFSELGKEIERVYTEKKFEETVSLISRETADVIERAKRELGQSMYDRWLAGSGEPQQCIAAIAAFHAAAGAAPSEFLELIAKSAISAFARFIDRRKAHDSARGRRRILAYPMRSPGSSGAFRSFSS